MWTDLAGQERGLCALKDDAPAVGLWRVEREQNVYEDHLAKVVMKSLGPVKRFGLHGWVDTSESEDEA